LITESPSDNVTLIGTVCQVGSSFGVGRTLCLIGTIIAVTTYYVSATSIEIVMISLHNGKESGYGDGKPTPTAPAVTITAATCSAGSNECYEL
jgi:hypothetical protein